MLCSGPLDLAGVAGEGVRVGREAESSFEVRDAFVAFLDCPSCLEFFGCVDGIRFE